MGSSLGVGGSRQTRVCSNKSARAVFHPGVSLGDASAHDRTLLVQEGKIATSHAMKRFGMDVVPIPLLFEEIVGINGTS